MHNKISVYFGDKKHIFDVNHFPGLLMLMCGSWITRIAFGTTISSPIVGSIITAAFMFTTVCILCIMTNVRGIEVFVIGTRFMVGSHVYSG
jgi:hypothetical protein